MRHRYTRSQDTRVVLQARTLVPLERPDSDFRNAGWAYAVAQLRLKVQSAIRAVVSGSKNISNRTVQGRVFVRPGIWAERKSRNFGTPNPTAS